MGRRCGRRRLKSHIPAFDDISYRRTQHRLWEIFHRSELSRPDIDRTDTILQRDIRTAMPQQLAHTQSHKWRRPDAGRHSRTRMVSGRRETCSGDTSRNDNTHTGQRETLARSSLRQLVRPSGIRDFGRKYRNRMVRASD